MKPMLLLAILFPLSPVAPVPDNGCSGDGVTAGITLICSGTCSSGTCESRGDGLDHRGAFSYCGCFAGDCDRCCTVVLRDGVARKRGTCPPCGASGRCRLFDNPDGELREPECTETTVHDPKPVTK
jgi:hypothetical protein